LRKANLKSVVKFLYKDIISCYRLIERLSINSKGENIEKVLNILILYSIKRV
ncbi:uncharacterized protein BDZ99DRAFT_387973, partial [Mytilinidion resinicola]